MKPSRPLLALVALPLLLIGCAAVPSTPSRVAPPPSAPASSAPLPLTGREQLNAVLWMQSSAEYAAITGQTFRVAAERLAGAALGPGTAALEQTSMPAAAVAALPTAIVVDLDETILDNSFYQARRARAGLGYDEPSWQAWMQEASAPALPGAADFLRQAAAAGHAVFYVTNRDCLEAPPGATDPCPAQTATMRNLRALDLPGADDELRLLMRSERAEWRSSDKSSRRAWVAARYRIVLMVGDDLRDFVDREVFAARREELSPLFGTRWFLLPNAMYGSWDRGLSIEQKYDRLDADPGAGD